MTTGKAHGDDASESRATGRSGHRANVALVHAGSAEEAQRRAGELRRGGYLVTVVGPMAGGSIGRRIDQEGPDAVVIELSRTPSYGQAVALALLAYRPTRHLPIIFVDGASDKVARVRANVPEAHFVSGDRLRTAVEKALTSGPQTPRQVRRSVFDPYRGVPLSKKLGIKPHSVVAVLHAPADIEPLLGELPEGATLRRLAGGPRDLTVWFVRSMSELEAGVEGVVRLLGPDGLWICWPKKSSGLKSDLSHNAVQRVGLTNGLMDYKICSIDQTWSALRFTARA